METETPRQYVPSISTEGMAQLERLFRGLAYPHEGRKWPCVSSRPRFRLRLRIRPGTGTTTPHILGKTLLTKRVEPAFMCGISIIGLSNL